MREFQILKSTKIAYGAIGVLIAIVLLFPSLFRIWNLNIANLKVVKFQRGEGWCNLLEKNVEFSNSDKPLYSLQNNPINSNLLAFQYYYNGRFDLAKQILDRQIDNNQNNKLTYFSLGCTLYAMGAQDAALNDWRQIGAFTYFMNKGDSLNKKQDTKGAEIYYQIANRIDPKASEPVYALADLYYSQGRVDDEVNLLEKWFSVTTSSHDENYYHFMGQLAKLKNDQVSAEAIYSTMVADFPQSIKARMDLGTLLFQQGKLNQAELQFEKISQISPDYPWSYVWLGRIASSKGDDISAIKFFGLATELEPTSSVFWSLLGRAYYRVGEMDKAISSLQKAISINSNDGELMVWLADAYIAQNNNYFSCQWYVRAEKQRNLSPEDVTYIQQKLSLLKCGSN